MSLVALAIAVACTGNPALIRQPAADVQAERAVVAATDLPAGWAEATAVSVLGLMPDLSQATARGFASSAWFRRGLVVRSTVLVLERRADAAAAFARAGSFGLCAELLFGAKRKSVRLGPTGYRVFAPRPAEPGSDAVELWYLHKGAAFAVVELIAGGPFDAALRRRILAGVAGRL